MIRSNTFCKDNCSLIQNSGCACTLSASPPPALSKGEQNEGWPGATRWVMAIKFLSVNYAWNQGVDGAPQPTPRFHSRTETCTLHLISLGVNVCMVRGWDHGGDGAPLPTPRFVSRTETAHCATSDWVWTCVWFVSHEPKPHTAPHQFGRERVYGWRDTNHGEGVPSPTPTFHSRTETSHCTLLVWAWSCVWLVSETMARVCPYPRFGFTHEPKPRTAPHQIGCERVYGSWDTNHGEGVPSPTPRLHSRTETAHWTTSFWAWTCVWFVRHEPWRGCDLTSGPFPDARSAPVQHAEWWQLSFEVCAKGETIVRTAHPSPRLGSCPTNRNCTLHLIGLGVNVCMVRETRTMAWVCTHPRPLSRGEGVPTLTYIRKKLPNFHEKNWGAWKCKTPK